ncbi:heme ABC transporter permease CcmC [Rhizobium sp. F40D2]|uniref:heme ABC transporter permease n=1 Tax=Rhizobium sp. F40D2 TaxID=3453141 RepID=UPI003F23973B
MNTVLQLRNAITGLSQPARFAYFADRSIPYLIGLTGVGFGIGFYLSFASDVDYQQGATIRIMYVHVPAAWLSLLCYTIMTVNAVGSLVWRHPLADVAARAAAPLGVAFTFVALVTGALWGKPMWGAWWVWDARLTSMFILLIMYLGIVAINRAIDEPTRAARVVAVLIIVGFVNIPIIKFSVDWWNTLHQPASVLRIGGPAVDIEFLRPLLTMATAFTAFFFTLYIGAIRNEIWRRKLVSQQRLAARAAAQREA